ncbi:MAG: DUF1667 domain-containing protein [Monoglobales bacterium]
MIKEFTCIVCPIGCPLKVEYEKGKVLSVSGNGCKRGAAYAESEYIAPIRTVTSTIRCEDGSMVSVKTSCPIPKEKIFECLEIINNAKAVLPVAAGDVIIEDVFGSNIVATQNRG